MKKFRSIKKLPLLVLLFSPLLSAADLSTYRGFQFGMSVSAALKHSGMNSSEVTTIHERPAQIQELAWNPERFPSASRETDPVQKIVLTFYKHQLSRIVVDYDIDKTSGLTSEDIIEAVSVTYGTAGRPSAETLLPSDVFSGGVKVIARWEDSDYSLDLIQSPYGSRFGLIARSKHLDGLAQIAIANGIRLDEQEAPQLQLAEEQNAQRIVEKTRLVNKPHFRP